MTPACRTQQSTFSVQLSAISKRPSAVGGRLSAFRIRLTIITILVTAVTTVTTVTPAYAGDSLYFIHTDHLGSTVAVTDEDGELVSQRRYYPYGEDRLSAVSGQPSATERSYTSQIQDSETSLYYYNARYYDPALGVFVSADPTDDSLNRFAYVGNNPIMSSDPTGHQIWRGGPDDPVVDESYQSPYFDDLLDTYLSQNQEVANILAGYYPTYPTRQIWELSKFVYSLQSTAWTSLNTNRAKIERNYTLAMGVTGYIPVPVSQIVRSLVEGYYGNRLEISAVREDMLRNDTETASPVEAYRLGLMRCYHRADLLSTYMQQYLPEIPVYAAGGPGHAFVLYEREDGPLMLVDPSGVLGSMENPMIPLPLSDAMHYHPDFDWLNLGYNPEMSSPLTSEEAFRRGVEDAWYVAMNDDRG